MILQHMLILLIHEYVAYYRASRTNEQSFELLLIGWIVTIPDVRCQHYPLFLRSMN